MCSENDVVSNLNLFSIHSYLHILIQFAISAITSSPICCSTLYSFFASATFPYIEETKASLLELQSRNFIIYHIDDTDENYFVASLYRKVEQEMQVGITMIKRCKMIAEANNKQS